MDSQPKMNVRSQYEYCNVMITPKMDAFIQKIKKQCVVPQHLLSHFKPAKDDGSSGRCVPFKDFRALYQLARKTDDVPYLHQLLAGTEIVLPKPVVEERSPELEARLERLRAEQANKEYDNMTSNIGGLASKKAPEESLSTQVKAMNKQLVFVANFVITVGCAFAFGYKAAELSLPKPNVPLQLIFGTILAMVVFIADLYFMIKSDLKF